MNLDQSSATPTAAPLAPPEWTMSVQQDGFQFTADIKRSGVLMCRLSLAGTEDEAAVRQALADKARYWIADYLKRSRGDRHAGVGRPPTPHVKPR